MKDYISSNFRLGVLGGGQLGRMLLTETQKYDIYTVILDGSVPQAELERMMDRSYGLVVRGMKKAERNRLVITHGSEAIFR